MHILEFQDPQKSEDPKTSGNSVLLRTPRQALVSPSCHFLSDTQVGDSLNLEVAPKQAAALHHQHAVLHRLIQGVGKEHLHIHGLPHLGTVQHLQSREQEIAKSGYWLLGPVATGFWKNHP